MGGWEIEQRERGVDSGREGRAETDKLIYKINQVDRETDEGKKRDNQKHQEVSFIYLARHHQREDSTLLQHFYSQRNVYDSI